jgi:hypothetical protein
MVLEKKLAFEGESWIQIWKPISPIGVQAQAKIVATFNGIIFFLSVWDLYFSSVTDAGISDTRVGVLRPRPL